jgi:transposase
MVKKKKTQDIEEHLINPKTLIEWAHLSLHARVIMIEKQFGVKISYQTLADLYKKHKIGFISPQYAYCRKYANKAEIAETQ